MSISNLFEQFIDNHMDEIVVEELKTYYSAVKDNNDPELTWAIDRVLKDYMVNEDYAVWRRENGKI